MENQLSIDWLGFTWKAPVEDWSADVSQFELFRKAFPEMESMYADSFLMNRKNSFYEYVLGFNDNVCVQYCDEYINDNGINLGINVQIPSHGLEWFFKLFDFDIEDDYVIQKMFILLKERGCKLSRLDLAYDDYTKRFRPKNYASWYMNDQIKTKFRKINFCASQSDIGHTFYLGTRRNNKIMRIYDKDFQSNGVIDCVRYEFELHSDFANEMMDYIITHGTLPFAQYLRGWFEVVVYSSVNSQKSNRHLLPEWELWLKDLCETSVSRKVDSNSTQDDSVVKIPHTTTKTRINETTHWFYTGGLLNEIKGFVSVFGRERLFAELEHAEIPRKYLELFEHVKNSPD